MGDRHIRGAPANVDGGDAQRPARLRTGLRLTVRTSKGGEEGFRLTAKAGDRFVIQPDQLTAAGFVPLHLDFWHRHHAFFLLFAGDKILILRVPSHRFPDNGDGFEHAAAENFSLLFRHGGGQRQDQGTQLARRRREAQAQARGDAVDLPQRLRQQFAQHVRHQRAAAVLRREDRQSFILRQREERLAVIVHQVHQRERGGKRFTLGFAVHLAKAPVLYHRCFIPQVATRTGDAAVTFGSQTLHRQLAGLITDADNRRPDKGIFATAFNREVLLAKTRLRKLKTAGKQRLIKELRLA